MIRLRRQGEEWANHRRRASFLMMEVVDDSDLEP